MSQARAARLRISLVTTDGYPHRPNGRGLRTLDRSRSPRARGGCSGSATPAATVREAPFSRVGKTRLRKRSPFFFRVRKTPAPQTLPSARPRSHCSAPLWLLGSCSEAPQTQSPVLRVCWAVLGSREAHRVPGRASTCLERMCSFVLLRAPSRARSRHRFSTVQTAPQTRRGSRRATPRLRLEQPLQRMSDSAH